MNINNYEKLFENYDNMELIHYNNVPDHKMIKVNYEDLNKTEIPGVLKGCQYIDGKLTQYYTPEENHVGIIASTRTGKTSSYVIPLIFSLASKKNKSSLILSDPKGELYTRTADKLKKEGYIVKLINFRDYLHSEYWNFLTPIYRKYQKAYDIYNEVEVVDVNGVKKNRFRGRIYENQKVLDSELQQIFDLAINEVGADIDDIAYLIIPSIDTKDPYWTDSARDLLKGFLYAMLEDSREENFTKKEPHKKITEDTYSISTIFKIMMTFSDSNSTNYEDNGYFTSRGENSMAYRLVKNNIIENAPNTRKCIVSEFNSKLSLFKEVTLRVITSCNSFELASITEGKPIAIYINYRDESRAHYRLISLFIQQAYQLLIDKANENINGKLERPFYLILDEFGNFPCIQDFDTTISACAGRNIFFVLVLQSFAQLNNVYGEAVANIIRDNLNVHVFFGSNNPGTLKEFSLECGSRTHLAPTTAINGTSEQIEQYHLETIPLIPISKLSHFAPGECVVTEANSGYIFWSKFERYYNCPEFTNVKLLHIKDYVSKINPFDRKYDYQIPKKPRKNYFDFD